MGDCTNPNPPAHQKPFAMASGFPKTRLINELQPLFGCSRTGSSDSVRAAVTGGDRSGHRTSYGKVVIMATTTLYVDQDSCTGCENCVETCPGVFRINEEGFSEVYDPDGASADEIKEAIDGCPSGAIKQEE
jgi:ferredoxin